MEKYYGSKSIINIKEVRCSLKYPENEVIFTIIRLVSVGGLKFIIIFILTSDLELKAQKIKHYVINALGSLTCLTALVKVS